LDDIKYETKEKLNKEEKDINLFKERVLKNVNQKNMDEIKDLIYYLYFLIRFFVSSQEFHYYFFRNIIYEYIKANSNNAIIKFTYI